MFPQLPALLTQSSPPLASLFANGENGYLHGNFGDLSQLFTVAFGPTNVAADNDPVALALDDHSWGGQPLSQVILGQPNVTPNGSWAMSVAGGTSTAVESPAGTLTLQSDGTNGARGDQSIATVAGQTYRVDFTVGTNAVTWLIGTTQGAQNIAAASPGVGTWSYYFTATGATTWVRFVRNAGGTTVVTGISSRLVPGNAGIQTTLVDRPTWKAGATGKPYLLCAGGSADGMVTYFYPFATGTGLTMAAAFNATLAGSVAIGGGDTAGNGRASIGFQGASTRLAVGWGTEIAETVSVDRSSQNLVMIVTGDAAGGRDVWLNGQNITSLFAASVGSPTAVGGALAIAGRQNSAGGGTDRNLGGNLNAALTIDRRLTLNEIANVTRQFQGTF